MKKSILLFFYFFIYIAHGANTSDCFEDMTPRARLVTLESRRDQEELERYDHFLATTEKVLSILADPRTPSFSLEDSSSVFQSLFSLCRSRCRLSGRPALFSGAALGDRPDPVYLERLQMLVIADALVANSFRHAEFYSLWEDSVRENSYASITPRLTQYVSEFQTDVPLDPGTIERLLNTVPSRKFFNAAFHMQEIFAPRIFVWTFIDSFVGSKPIQGWTLSRNTAWVTEDRSHRTEILTKMNCRPLIRINSTLGRGTVEGTTLVVDYLLVPWVEKDRVAPITFRLERELLSLQKEVRDFAYQEHSAEAKRAAYKRGACLRESHWNLDQEEDLFKIFLPLGDPLIQFHYAMALEESNQMIPTPTILENCKQAADQGCPWAQNNYSRLVREKDPGIASLYSKLAREVEKRE